MHSHQLPDWQHTHAFGQDQRRPGERRTLAVIGINLLTMFAEIWAGLAFGSMALLADGLHMGSHTAALSLTFAAYVLARRLAGSPRFSFGTGKLNALAGLVGAILFAHNTFAAMQDVATDALAVDVLPADERGKANSARQQATSAVTQRAIRPPSACAKP